ncbi:S9 family peptidase [bacterium]|nr:S9 family peptidase [bacterium]
MKEPTSDSDLMLDRYQRAQTTMQGAWGVKKLALNTVIYPHWIGDSDCFWYQQETLNGKSFRVVDAETQLTENAFDHKALAEALTNETGESIDPENLPLTVLEITLSPRAVNFTAFGESWHYDDASHRCKKVMGYPESWKVSPDGKLAAFVRGYNIWLRDLTTGDERPLTEDGEEFYRYAGEPTYTGAVIRSVIDVLWSPDSKQLVTHLIDTRQVSFGIPLVQHVPQDGGLRPTVINPERRQSFYGDKNIEAWQLVVIDVETAHLQRVDHPPIPMNYPAFEGYFQVGRAWWDADNRHVYFIHQENDWTNTRVLRWNTLARKTEWVFEEDPEIRGYLRPATHQGLLILPIPETGEIVWYSERSGWAHFYLYDLKTGKLKNAITSGNWLVRSILHFDSKQRELWIQTAGRIVKRNPYLQDICRVNIDTGELTPVISTEHNYSVSDQKSNSSIADRASLGVSPSGRYVVTTRSRVDQTPVSLLLDREGRELLTLETAEVSDLPEGWQWPEPVETLAADGKSTISGIVYRPPGFSADKSYPILDYSFLTYAEPVDAFGWLNLEAMAHAELGFIVVKFFNRAMPGLRDVAFRDFKDHTLPYPCMADNAAGIRQLAAERCYMDSSRVGGAIHSSLPTGLGVLVHPDVYTVGVTMNTFTDPRLLGGLCAAFGGAEFAPFEKFAENLHGKLLLIAGMLDPAIPVTNTFRLVEALQTANRSFDMLVLPNFGHEMSDYVRRRTWDYLVEHLLGVEAPDNFPLTISEDKI